MLKPCILAQERRGHVALAGWFAHGHNIVKWPLEIPCGRKIVSSRWARNVAHSACAAFANMLTKPHLRPSILERHEKGVVEGVGRVVC